MTEAEAFRRLEETCSMGHGPTVRKRRDCMTCQVLLLVEVSTEEREACAKIADDYRKSAVDSGVPQIILLGGAAQIIRNSIRARGRE